MRRLGCAMEICISEGDTCTVYVGGHEPNTNLSRDDLQPLFDAQVRCSLAHTNHPQLIAASTDQ
jgi:hypothetical protein